MLHNPPQTDTVTPTSPPQSFINPSDTNSNQPPLVLNDTTLTPLEQPPIDSSDGTVSPTTLLPPDSNATAQFMWYKLVGDNIEKSIPIPTFR